MKCFTGWEYMLIDLANHFGLDKETFEKRLEWVNANLADLEVLVAQADCKPLYMKAVLAIRKVQRGFATGHMVGLDACCSGIQVMSALTGDVTGANNVGFVDPDVRADAYGRLTSTMQDILGADFHVNRKDAKQALMTVYYGSKEQPKLIFGEDTPELNAFYQAAMTLAPGAWELLQDLLASWRPWALVHAWKLPDGFDARVKVMVKKEARIEVDELDHASFTYEFYENEGTKAGLSNVANVVHSVDAYVLRCVHRRCNYDRAMVMKAWELITDVLDGRTYHGDEQQPLDGDTSYYVFQYQRSGMADIVILPHLVKESSADQLSTEHLQQLLAIVESMLSHQPFPVVTVHDEYKCHPNHMNHLRRHYINVFAELAESNVLSDILSQIHGKQGSFTKLSPALGAKIRGSNYALS